MIRHGFDIGFLFSPDEGHYSCICSRCLSVIREHELALRILAALDFADLQEYRYCEACQRGEGITPKRQLDPRLEAWRRAAQSHPRFRLSPAEVRLLMQRARMIRNYVEKGRTKPWVHLGTKKPI